MSHSPNDRALAIARGLVVTGRARVRDMHSGGYIRMMSATIETGGAPQFWISHDGERVIESFPDATDRPLSPELIEELGRAGASVDGRAVELKPGPTPTPEEDPSLYDDFDWPYRPPGWRSPIEVPEEIRQLIEARRAGLRSGAE